MADGTVLLPRTSSPPAVIAEDRYANDNGDSWVPPLLQT